MAKTTKKVTRKAVKKVAKKATKKAATKPSTKPSMTFEKSTKVNPWILSCMPGEERTKNNKVNPSRSCKPSPKKR